MARMTRLHLLELEFHTELNLARVECGGESERIRRLGEPVSFNAIACERRRADNIVHARKVSSVKKIERLDDSFQPVIGIFTKTELLRYSQIEVDVIRPAAGIPACESRAIRIRLRIVVRVESEQEVEGMSASISKDWCDGNTRNRIGHTADDQAMPLIKRGKRALVPQIELIRRLKVRYEIDGVVDCLTQGIRHLKLIMIAVPLGRAHSHPVIDRTAG